MSKYPKEGETLRVAATGRKLVYRSRRTVNGAARFSVTDVGGQHRFEIEADLVIREEGLHRDLVKVLDDKLAETVRKEEEYRAAYEAKRAEEQLAQELANEIDDAVWAAAPTRLEDDGTPDHVTLIIDGPEYPVVYSKRTLQRNVGGEHEGELGYMSRRTLEVTAYANNTVFMSRDRYPGVNWSAIGTSSPAVTRRYAELMIEAIAVAERITAEYEARKTAWESARGIS